jgi:[protein-PII] uridylyltransferase
VVAEVTAALEGRGAIDRRLAERARDYSWAARAKAARTSAPVVLFDDAASDRATVDEVRAPDGLGVLFRVTSALADCGVDIATAKVSTLGHEVVDAFYVTEVDGGKVTSPEHQAAIEARILDALAAT